MRICVESRIDNLSALQYANETAKFLERLGHEVVFGETTTGALKKQAPFRSWEPDLVLGIGGDGTILLSVQQRAHQVPVLGINWGEVGFLAGLEPEEARDFLTQIDKGFTVDRRMRIALEKDNLFLGNALNEALIVTVRPAKMLRFEIIIDGTLADHFRADGLLVSTPTGSTAYAMSAGGPIVDPKVDGFLLVPLAPYMLSSRPHIISTGRTLEIRLSSGKPANLVLDGQSTHSLGTEGAIRVRVADEPALFVDTKKNFFSQVDSKLRRL